MVNSNNSAGRISSTNSMLKLQIHAHKYIYIGVYIYTYICVCTSLEVKMTPNKGRLKKEVHLPIIIFQGICYFSGEYFCLCIFAGRGSKNPLFFPTYPTFPCAPGTHRCGFKCFFFSMLGRNNFCRGNSQLSDTFSWHPKGMSPSSLSFSIIFINFSGTSNRTREVQPSKTRWNSSTTEFGTITWVKAWQPSKAFSLIVMTESGRWIWCKELQPAKARWPMLSTSDKPRKLKVSKQKMKSFQWKRKRF